MPTRTNRPIVTPFAQRVRADLLAYLEECVQNESDPGSFPKIAARLGTSKDAIIRCMGDLRREGEINYAWKKPNWGKTLTVRCATPIVSKGERQCARCLILCRHLDRAGYCCMCQIELAYGKPYRPGMAGIRVRVEGMDEPKEPSRREQRGGIHVPNWPTGVLQEVRL